MKTKACKFYLKTVDEKGTFEGLAAVYGNVDLGDDIIEPGAFTKTLKDSKGKVPVLWQHDMRAPVGLGILEDSKEGLLIHGELVMEVPKAQEAYALMKKEVMKGLSIGYDTIVSEYDKDADIRRLKELRLWEVSLVTFPMNPEAQITAVKDINELILTDALELARAEIKAGRKLPDELIKEIDELKALIDGSAAEPTQEPDLHSAFDAITQILSKGLSR